MGDHTQRLLSAFAWEAVLQFDPTRVNREVMRGYSFDKKDTSRFLNPISCGGDELGAAQERISARSYGLLAFAVSSF
jgi:hypothetical protein